MLPSQKVLFVSSSLHHTMAPSSLYQERPPSQESRSVTSSEFYRLGCEPIGSEEGENYAKARSAFKHETNAMYGRLEYGQSQQLAGVEMFQWSIVRLSLTPSLHETDQTVVV
jgi:hypothetical protein